MSGRGLTALTRESESLMFMLRAEHRCPCTEGIEDRLAAIEAAVRESLVIALDREETRLWEMSSKYGLVGPGSIGALVDMTNVAGSFDSLRRILATPDASAAPEARDLAAIEAAAAREALPTVEELSDALHDVALDGDRASHDTCLCQEEATAILDALRAARGGEG